MATIEEHLRDPLYANWVKCGKALEIANDVGRQFVQKEIQRFHEKIISGITWDTPCTSCTIETAAFCSKGICNRIRRKIIKTHRYGNPTFSNTHVGSWLMHPWEIAKCYMPKRDCYMNCSPSDADFSVTINVIINNLHFSSLVSFDENNPNDKYYQSKTFRNTVFHPGRLQMGEVDMITNLDILNDILTETAMPSSDDAKAKINEIKVNKLTLTMEDVFKIRVDALRALDLSQELIEKGIKYIQEEFASEKRALEQFSKDPEKLLLSNFTRGSDHALVSLLKTHIQNNKPRRIRNSSWTLESFLEKIELNSEMENLSEIHKEMLFPDTGNAVNIDEWDPFLTCFVLKTKSIVELPNPVEIFIDELQKTRDKLLNSPKKFKKEKFKELYDCLDEPLKQEVRQIFENENLSDILTKPEVILQAWQRNDDQLKKNSQVKTDKEIEVIVEKKVQEELRKRDNRTDELERRFNAFVRRFKEFDSAHEAVVADEVQGAVGGIDTSQDTFICVVPRHTSAEDKERLQTAMTNPKINNGILQGTGAIEYMNDKTNCPFKNALHGSIIVEVECPSTTHLFKFWKGCIDGSVAEAMSKIRDEYRKYLGCETLEFDIVLKKKEVLRCLEKIFQKSNSRFEELERRLNGVVDAEDLEDLRRRIKETESQELQTTTNVQGAELDNEETAEHLVKPETMITESKELSGAESDYDLAKKQPMTTELSDSESDYDDAKEDMDKKEQGTAESMELSADYDILTKTKQLELIEEVQEEKRVGKLEFFEEDIRAAAGTSKGEIKLGASSAGGKYGEQEANRLVKFLRQISENLEGGKVSAVRPYLHSIMEHSGKRESEEFGKDLEMFTEAVAFKGGISVNLIKQTLRGFILMQEEPKFGELVLSKIILIEKEESEQMTQITKGSEKPIFGPIDVNKSSVIIEDDIDVVEAGMSGQLETRARAEKVVRPSEKGKGLFQASTSSTSSYRLKTGLEQGFSESTEDPSVMKAWERRKELPREKYSMMSEKERASILKKTSMDSGTSELFKPSPEMSKTKLATSKFETSDDLPKK